MNIHPNIDPLSAALKPETEKPQNANPTEAPSPEKSLFQSDKVDLTPEADPIPENISIQNDADAATATLSAAQQIQTGTPDDLYDWSSMTPERLKELLS